MIINAFAAVPVPRAARIGAIATITVFTLGLADLFLGEIFNLYQFIGGVIVLTGSFFISRIKLKQANF